MSKIPLKRAEETDAAYVQRLEDNFFDQGAKLQGMIQDSGVSCETREICMSFLRLIMTLKLIQGPK